LSVLPESTMTISSTQEIDFKHSSILLSSLYVIIIAEIIKDIILKITSCQKINIALANTENEILNNYHP